MATTNDAIIRATGLLVILVQNSNPNGDPDRESDPRTRSHDQRGVITGVSFKRKLRDLVDNKEGDVWKAVAHGRNPDEHQILESRGRNRDEIKKLTRDTFVTRYWDARVFGNTFLESMKDEKKKEGIEPNDKDHFIRSGVVQLAVGVSVAPVRIERSTLTNKAGVQEGLDRGMAPLGQRIVQHGVYCMPFFINPTAATKSGCTRRDISLLLSLFRAAYPETRSVARPLVEVIHAWYAEHKDRLGSFSEFEFIEAMKPRRKGDSERPSVDSEPLEAQYDIPTQLPDSLRDRAANFTDLCVKLPAWCEEDNRASAGA